MNIKDYDMCKMQVTVVPVWSALFISGCAITSHSPEMPGFNPGPFCLGFVVDKVALEQVFFL
jgi:hypothetical protein